jgi:uncharacterized protein (DUF1778 family)
MKQPKKTPIQIGVTDAERKDIEAAAAIVGVTPATYIKIVALRDARAGQ